MTKHEINAVNVLPEPTQVGSILPQPRAVDRQVIKDRLIAMGETPYTPLTEKISSNISNTFSSFSENRAEKRAKRAEKRLSRQEKRNAKNRGRAVLGALGVVGAFAVLAPSFADAQTDPAPDTTVPSDLEVLAPEGYVDQTESCVERVPDSVVDIDGTDVIETDMGVFSPVRPGSTNGEHRLWSDAVSTPLEGDTPAEMRQSFYDKLCTDPVLLSETMERLAEVEISGERIGDANEFMSRYVDATPADINDLAMEYVPLLNATADGNIPTASEQADAVAANELMQSDAQSVIALFEQLQLVGIGTRTATETVHVSFPGLNLEGGIPEFRMDRPYEGRFLVFRFSQKSGNGYCPQEIIVNINDARTGFEDEGDCEIVVPVVPDIPEEEEVTPPPPPPRDVPSTTTTEPTTSTTEPTTTTTEPTTTTTEPTTTTTEPTTTTTEPTTTTTEPTTTTTEPQTHDTVDGPPDDAVIENEEN